MATRATTLWSLDAVRDWLRKGETLPTTLDAEIERIADDASEFLEKSLRLAFVERTVTEKYDGTGSQWLRLRRRPVKSVTTLKIKEEQEGSFTTMDAGDFDLFGADDPEELKSGEIRLKSTASITSFPALRGNVEAVYVAGFGTQDSADLPADISRVGLDLVKFGWTKYMSDGVASSQIAIGPGNFFFREDLPIEILRTLKDWQQPLVA